MLFCVGSEPEPSLIDCAGFTNAGENVLERTSLRNVIVNVVSCYQRYAGEISNFRKVGDIVRIIAAITMICSEVAAPRGTFG